MSAVKTAARAIAGTRINCQGITPPCGSGCACIASARAAIASLREPTPEMVEAGKRVRYGRTPTTGKMWTAMLDAALSEPRIEQQGDAT